MPRILSPGVVAVLHCTVTLHTVGCGRKVFANREGPEMVIFLILAQ